VFLQILDLVYFSLLDWKFASLGEGLVRFGPKAFFCTFGFLSSKLFKICFNIDDLFIVKSFQMQLLMQES
jgi:hypothetical protein